MRVVVDRVVSVAGGNGHAVVVSASADEQHNGAVYGFGRNNKSQIGGGSAVSGVPVLMVANGATHVAETLLWCRLPVR